MGELEGIDASMKTLEATKDTKVFLFPTHAIDEHLAVVGPAREEVTVAHVGCRQQPGVISVQASQGVDGLLFVHDPQIDGVVSRPSQEELTVDHVQSVDSVELARVEQLGVLIDFPEDNLVVHSARDDSISRKRLDPVDVTVVAVVSVHVLHFPQIPHFHRPVLRHRVELVVLPIERDSRDRVTMAQKALHLCLVVDVPHSHESIFAPRNQVLAIWRDCSAEHLVVMASNGSVELLSAEEQLRL